ncbi:MAG: LamG-like jellyroll fold domain-containing protein [Candidatus Hodarchaeota archaeon]
MTKGSSLVAYWDFDEGSGSTVTDYSGNGNDGIVTGATWVTGKNGTALLFSANGDYVQVADSDSLDPSTALTIEAWIKADSFDGNAANSGNVIISKWLDWNKGQAQFMLTAYTGGGLCFKINGVQARHDLRVENQLSVGVWHHILATWNEEYMVLVVDGEIVACESSLVISMYSTEYVQDYLRIGNLGSSSSGWQFKGVIDEVSIYHDFNDDFHYISPPEVLFPSGGEVLSGITTIQWTAVTDQLGHSVTYEVSYSTDKGGYHFTVLASGLTGTTYQWDTTTVADGSWNLIKVKATCTAGSNAQGKSDVHFTIHNSAHTLSVPTIFYPNGGETLEGAVDIRWNASSDSLGHAVTYTVFYSANGGSNWTKLGSSLTGTSYTWDTTTAEDGTTYLIRVLATCLGSRIPSSDISDDSFTVYNRMPRIRLSNLINNTAQPPSTPISLNITDDTGISFVSYHWDDRGINSTLTAPYTISLPISNGSHILHVYASNNLNHWAHRRFVFITDGVAPIITLASPLNGTHQLPSTQINLNITDNIALKSVLYTWEGESNTTLSMPYAVFLPSTNGQHILQVYANDSARNWATAFFVFYTDDGTLDSDMDGLPDWWELQHNFDAFMAADASDDADSDNLSNLAEYGNGTNPQNADTDNDGMTDGWEVSYSLNPTDPTDAEQDADGDLISNLAEYQAGTNPRDGFNVPLIALSLIHMIAGVLLVAISGLFTAFIVFQQHKKREVKKYDAPNYATVKKIKRGVFSDYKTFQQAQTLGAQTLEQLQLVQHYQVSDYATAKQKQLEDFAKYLKQLGRTQNQWTFTEIAKHLDVPRSQVLPILHQLLESKHLEGKVDTIQELFRSAWPMDEELRQVKEYLNLIREDVPVTITQIAQQTNIEERRLNQISKEFGGDESPVGEYLEDKGLFIKSAGTIEKVLVEPGTRYSLCFSLFDEQLGPFAIYSSPNLSEENVKRVALQTIVLGSAFYSPSSTSKTKRESILSLEDINKAIFIYLFGFIPKVPQKFRGRKILGAFSILTDTENHSLLYRDASRLSTALDELLELLKPQLRDCCSDPDLTKADFSVVQAILTSYRFPLGIGTPVSDH